MSNEDGSGPAFPEVFTDEKWSETMGAYKRDTYSAGGMSQRAYAAIHLRVTDPALPEWLNAMIERARRDEFAVSATEQDIQASIKVGSIYAPYDRAAARALHADAMLAQGRKG